MELVIVLSPERRSKQALEFAVRRACEAKLTLRVVYVLEESIIKAVERELAEIGFIGDKPGHEVAEALQKEHTSRGQKIIDELGRLAKVQNVSLEQEFVTGYYCQVCDEFARKNFVAELVLVSLKRGFLQKIFSSDELKQVAACCHKPIHTFLIDSD